MSKTTKTIMAFLTAMTMTVSAMGVTAYAEEINETVLGDANSDGKANVRDCALIASAAAKGSAEKLPDAADYNRDKKKNVRDAAALSRDLSARDSEYISKLIEIDDDKAFSEFQDSVKAAKAFEKTFDGTFDNYDPNDVYAEYKLTGFAKALNGKTDSMEDVFYNKERDGYGLRNIIYSVNFRNWLINVVMREDGSLTVCEPVLPNGWKKVTELREEEQKLRKQIDEEIADVKYGGAKSIGLNDYISYDLSVIYFRTVSGKEYAAPYVKGKNYREGDFNYTPEGIENGKLYTGAGLIQALREVAEKYKIDESYLAPEIDIDGLTYSLIGGVIDHPINFGKVLWTKESNVSVDKEDGSTVTYPVEIYGLEIGPEDYRYYDYFNYLKVYYREQGTYALYRVAIKPTDGLKLGPNYPDANGGNS